MNNKKKYLELLESINENAVYIKNIAVLILKESLKKKKQEEKMTLVAYSENFLFAFLDEVGKFYLIEKQFPNKIGHLNLSFIGFRKHNKKLEALNDIIRERQKRLGGNPQFTTEQIIKTLRQFKDTTLYIDYKNSKIIKPSDSVTLNPKIFDNYVKLINILSNMMENDLSYFKLYK